MENGLKKLFEKLKNMKKNQWLILALTGILLLVIALPTRENQTAETTETIQAETQGEAEKVKKLERRLESALENVEGVGKVTVMLTLKSGGEKVVEKDRPVTDSTTKEDSEEGSRSTVEKTAEESTVFVQDGDGVQTPYVVEELEPQIQGVVVVAEGGGNSVVVENITEAVMALFGVEPHKIKVMKRN